MSEVKIQKRNILPTSHKFARNSIYNVAGFAVTFPILILLTPYMLRILGNAQFGIWAIAGVVTSYAQLSDMGMTTAIVKFVAEYWIERDVSKINKLTSTAFLSFAMVGGIVVAAILIGRKLIVINILRVPANMQSEALFVVSGVVIIFYFNLVLSVYNAVLLGIQRMDITNTILVVSKVLRALGMWAFLAAGMGLKGLICNSAIFSGLTIIANIVIVSTFVPGFKIRLRKFSLSTFKTIASYSANIFAARIIALGQEPINKVILARYVGLTHVAFYEIGERITKMVRQLFQIAIYPLLPAASELQSKNKRKEIGKIYLDLSRLLYWIAVPVSVLVISLAEPIVFIWLGDGYILAARTIQFMTIGFLFSLLVTPQYVILQGIGKPKINTINHVIVATINTFLGIFLTIHIGYYGVLIAIVFSYIIAFFHLDISLRKILKLNNAEYISNMPILFLTFTIVMGLGIHLLIKTYFVQWNILTILSLILSVSLANIFLYAIIRSEEDRILFNNIKSIVRNVGHFYSDIGKHIMDEQN